MKSTFKLTIIVLVVASMFACHQAAEEKVSGGGAGVQTMVVPNENKEPEAKAEESYKAKKASSKRRGTYEVSVTDAQGASGFSQDAASVTNGSTTSNNWNGKNVTENQFISSTAAVETGKDTGHKFIRTADMKFKVKSVVNATYAIENIIKMEEGWVASTNLSSNIDRKTTISVSVDSSVESTYYTVVNDMTLRVPNTKLDTTLKSIATLIDYLDYREIKAEDVSIKILENKLARERALKSAQRVSRAIDDKGRKLNDITDAEELLANKEEQADNEKIANMTIQDQINFSTIKLSIYQRQTIKRELVSNNKNIDAFSPGFGTRVKDALKSGWEILTSIIVFLAQIWWLILLVIAGYFVYRAVRPRFRK